METENETKEYRVRFTGYVEGEVCVEAQSACVCDGHDVLGGYTNTHDDWITNIN